MESDSFPIVNLKCVQVIKDHDQPRDHNRQDDHNRIKFFIHPESNHSEYFWIAPYTAFEPTETAIVGPAVELDLTEFCAHSRKRIDQADGDPDFEDYELYDDFMDLLADLDICESTKHAAMDEIISQALGQIPRDTEEKFDVEVSVQLHVSTFYTRDVFVEDDEGDDGLGGMIPAAEEAIEMLERVRVDEETKERQCSICLEDYVGENECCRLGCSHLFHAHCLRTWLKKSHYCPLCRFELPVRVSST